MAVTAGVPPVEERRRRFLDNECAATGQTCKMGPYGPGGAIQCEFCGATPTQAVDFGEAEARVALFLAGDNTDLTPAERAEVERRVSAMRPEFAMPYGTVTGRLTAEDKEALLRGDFSERYMQQPVFPNHPAGYDTKKRKFRHNRRG